VVNHVPKLSRTAAEQILADYEGYAALGTQSTYKKAQKLAKRFGKFKTSRTGQQLEAQQDWLRTPVTRLEAASRSTTPSTTPLPVTGGKHSHPPSFLSSNFKCTKPQVESARNRRGVCVGCARARS
jgi:hypothetical protein